MILWMLTMAWADCTGASLHAEPAAEVRLPPRAELLLDAYGMERGVLDKVTRYSLDGPEGEVPLTVVAHLRGDFQDDQIVLRPEGPLAAGDYVLRFDGTARTVWTGQGHAPIRWRVGGKASVAPTWSGPASVVDQDRTLFGCGPAVSVTLAVPVADATWVEVALVREGGEAVTGRARVDDGRVVIGHGMCSGVFELEMGEAYTASLTAIGAEGQRVAATEPVRFVAP